MSNSFFQTKFNHKIPIVKDYRNAHNKVDYRDFVDTFKKTDSFTKAKAGFLNDLFEYSLIFDFLESWGINKKFNSSLDIGGQEGFISKILTAEGKCKYSDCVEIFDYRSNINFKKLVNYYNYLKFTFNMPLLKHVDKIKKRLKSIEQKGTKFGHYSLAKLWRINFQHEGTIREYILDDVYNINNKYDLITAFFCLEHFDHTKLFKKISSLLNENGIFVFMDSYWWWPVNSSRIIGYFPYAAQRLTKDDFVRYVEEFHPDEKEGMLKKYDFFGNGLTEKPTLHSYITEAEKNGLSLVAYNRFMPFQDTQLRTPITPKILDECHDTNLNEVLRDIHEFRTDVNIEDLKTAFILIAFRKKVNKEKSVSDWVQNLEKDGYGYYRKKDNK